MGRQLNQIIEGLSAVTGATSTINVNLDAIEALLTTLQADVADGVTINQPVAVTDNSGSLTVDGTVTANAGTGSFTVAQATHANLKAQAQILDSSGNQITYAATGAAGTPASDVVTVQGVGGMTALTVAQATAANLNATVVQGTATNLKTQAEAYQGGSAVSSSNPLQVTLANTASNSTAVNIAPRNGAVTVTAGTTSGTANTSAQALASSSTRRYLLIQNISDTDMYFNFGAAATTSHLLVKSGGAEITFETGFVPTDAVNVICSAASKSYYILSA